MPQLFGSNELIEDVHKRNLCIGCGAWVDLCPYFKNYKGKTAQLFPCTLEQGRCYAFCPKAEVDLNALTLKTRGVDYAGSKFMASPTVSAVNMAARKGFRRIGVVGTPCQMTAVAQMHSNPLGKEEHKVPIALTIGLFCNWSLDTRRLMNLLADKLDPAGMRKMDIPPPPADTVILETDDGPIQIALSEIKPLIPHTCFICMDMTAELADLAVGMFEGKPGWNTVIIPSETGAQIVDQAREEGYIETADFPATNLTHLSKAAAGLKCG
ncbi:MAG: hypothetical protein GY850_34710 [bacterium]|nr:hypothetical protein [bacterium]